MSVLVIMIPPRARLSARGAAAIGAPRAAGEFDYVFSADGSSVTASGRAAPALLPKATSVVAVLADADVSWHRLALPRAPAARLRAALVGTLEELLLDDEAALHFAVAPDADAGQDTWVAVTHRSWLAAQLAEIEAAAVVVDRVVPSSAPGDVARGHFFVEGEHDAATMLALSHADGAVCVGSTGSLARSLLPADPAAVAWTATPAAAGAAEEWLGGPVAVLPEAQRALQAAASGWNLRQFDLAPRHRGMLALRDLGRRVLSPQWRPVRWGLGALVAVQILGLNLAAWQQRQALSERRAAMTELLRTAHPGIRAVIDPPLQMRRETERLRTAAGRPGDGDLEVLLGAAAAAWPDGQGPVQTLRFEPGRLTLAAGGWGESQVAQFRDRLRPAGYATELADGRVTVVRGAVPVSAGPAAARVDTAAAALGSPP